MFAWTRSLRWSLVVAIAWMGSPSLRAEAKLDWSPANTWVFAVGLLQWQNAELWSSFPAAMKDRRDEQLVNFFRRSGVPADQIVYLQDAAATKRRIEREFVRLLENMDEGDLLVFYFCGHGYRDALSGQTWFANYDAGKNNSSAWSVPGIFTTIEKHFPGKRVLLLADCCHSGALFDEALNHRNSPIAYAALTSSYSHSTSTGQWTFTDSVLTALRGHPTADATGDRIVDLSEIAQYTEQEMAFIEGQKSMFTAAKLFPRAAVFSPVVGRAAPPIGDRVEVCYEGKWYKAKVIDARGEQFKIHYTNYDDSWDEWVGRDRMRAYHPVEYAVGDAVEVHWSQDRNWYPATVLKVWNGLHLIRYDGYSSTWDEWVGPHAVRRPAAGQ